MKPFIPVLAATASAIVLGSVACGDGGAGTDAGTTVTVAMNEWSMKLDRTAIPAGEITIIAKNRGAETHELILLKAAGASGKLVSTDGKVDEELFASPGEIEGVKPGTTKAGKLTLEPGRYLLICNLVAHYEQGMHTEITVQ